MLPTRQGSIRLFRFAGIDLFLHWSWFLVAIYGIQSRRGRYDSPLWPALEYFALFAIVLMHEFGHALACRQVGGRADQIVLWPLGGVAYVSPPPRPGPTLWSIAAGPLVNLVLAPIFSGVLFVAGSVGWAETMPDLYVFIHTVWLINFALLVFNLLPIYPLDGGQILQSLLWFWLGRARSLMVAAIIGFFGVGGLVLVAVAEQSWWLVILAVFILLNCWRGLLNARILAKAAKLPRHAGFMCPNCHQAPISGSFWRCGRCMQPFDPFESNGACPHCASQFPVTQCLECGQACPISQWSVPPPVLAPR